MLATMKHKSLNSSSHKLANSERYEFTSVAIGWFIAVFIVLMDYSHNCHIFRYLTACYIPLSVCYLIDFGIMIFGITNIIACVISLLDFDIFSKIVNPFSLSRSLQNQSIQLSQEPDALTRKVNVRLDRSFFDRSSGNVSSSPEYSFFNRRSRGPGVIRRSSASSIHDIYTDGQLDKLSDVMLTSFAHKTFEPRVNHMTKRYNYKYYPSQELSEEEEEHLSLLDQSQLDILNLSEHYETNPEEHPLEGPKRKPDNTAKGRKRGRHSLSPSETRARFHQTYNVFPRCKNAKLSRIPKFLKNQKPTVTSISKLFKDNWHINGEQFTIMVEDLRRFISRKIIQPLAKEIQCINDHFRSHNPTRNVSIGKTSIVVIEKVFGRTRDKEIANIPHVLSYLRLHPNYSHFVKRILTWAQTETIFDYFPDDTTPKTTGWPSSFPRSTAPLPTDSELIFLLFCHFMDIHCGLYPITYPYPCDLPFTRLHVLAETQQPSEVHSGDNGYYVECSELKPISFKFHTSRYPAIVSHPTSNALLAILMLLVYGHGNEWYQILNNRVARS